MGVNTDPQRRVVANVNDGTGDFYDGERDSISVKLELKPSPHFRAFIGYEHNDVESPQGDFVLRASEEAGASPRSSDRLDQWPHSCHAAYRGLPTR